jgi:hypothetical protein
MNRIGQPRVVHRLRGVGLIHGNVVRPLCFDVGEQRKQRHMFDILVSAKRVWLRRPVLRGELWGEHYCVLGFVTLCVNELARRIRDLPSIDTGHPV